MGKSDIESWIASTSTSSPAEDSENPSGNTLLGWRRNLVVTDWQTALSAARRLLLLSSTKIRTQFLQEELLYIARNCDLNLSQTLEIFQLLTLTYSRYVDAPSREAVEAVGVELVRRDELRGTPEGEPDDERMGVAEQIVGWLSQEIDRMAKRPNAYPPADMLVLLSWCTGIYSVCAEHNPHFASSVTWGPLLGSVATLLDLILDKANRAKPTVQKGALVRARRALRSNPRNIPGVIRTLIARTKGHSNPLHVVSLLGVAIDVKLRLKNVKDEDMKKVDGELKTEIIAFYNASVLMSRTAVPLHVRTALHGFIESTVDEKDLEQVILPQMEKSLLRSPEISLSVIASFFEAYSQPIDSATFKRVLTATVNNAKSSNAIVRTGAIQLFKTVISKASEGSDLKLALDELLTLPRSGKTAGADHRVALYTMLGHLPPSQDVSPAVVEAGPALLTKETHDGAISVLAASLARHIVFCLLENITIPAATQTAIARDMNAAKPPIRRAFSSLVGNVLWELRDLQTQAALDFAKAVLPSLETSLKTVAASPAAPPAGPLEGYIAVALLLGPYHSSGKFEDVVSRNATLQGLLTSGAKPSFLLWEKVYQKLAEPEDQAWLLRAGEAVLSFYKSDIVKSEQTSAMVGNIFLHLAVDSSSVDIRRLAITSMNAQAPKYPEVVSRIVSTSLKAYLVKESASAKVSNGEDAETKAVSKEGRLCAFLISCAAIGQDIDQSVRESLVLDLLVVSYHPAIAGQGARLPWIELCLAAGVNPNETVTMHWERILPQLIAASESSSSGFIEASYRAVTTLSFVAPQAVIPQIVEQLRRDIDAQALGGLTEEDLAIWATPEGTTYIDVLSNKKSDEPVKKGKGYKDAQWEAEVRKSLATKKQAATGSLSKQDQALVNAQLEKEAAIRRRVDGLKTRLERGLALVRSLVKSNAEELKVQISSLVNILLSGAFGNAADTLVGENSFKTYLDLSACCSDRILTFSKWIGIATLRSLEVPCIPDELQEEPINALVLRVLHRLRFLSEQVPFDVATFSYTSPLLNQIFLKGAIGLTEDDDPLEQAALALDLVKFHTGEFTQEAYPRKQTMENLLFVIRQQPKLAKDASSALIDIGQAVQATVKPEELTVLLRGILIQEVYVRNACLQTLQPFDLTELDWSPELWIACHDDDEQNVRLAEHLWEDNGLDVPESYLQSLIGYLEHDNAYVRASTAAAIADAVEHWPQSITSTLSDVQEFYREKAKILAPEFDQYGMVIASTLDRADPWPSRVAVARAFELMAPSFTPDNLEPFFKFLINDEALGDRHPDVRKDMLQAGNAVIDLHGPARLAELIAIFEEYLGKSQPANETQDFIKEAIVILFGRLAKHLDPSDPRVSSIVERLVDALKTPAEQVQIAVSDCLSPLVRQMRTPVEALVDRLFEDLFNGQKYAIRRGAAYGLAGVIKGAGISSMKDFNVIDRLRAAAEDKKRFEPRQGVMFAFETFSNVLGRLFEPYVIHILPMLLTAFGDATNDVREATYDAARVIMGNLSGYGVKTILPTLLEGLDEKQWRTKKGSIELLGMMAYCAPRQLSQSLPIVIPRLTGVLTDSHAQVRAAANKSLKMFGEVISNPEIQSLVPVFLKAMVDPAKTSNALTALLKTSFAHYIDHSSLALVVPIIERGLRERGADIKKKAAQIVGNLASLTDSKDFVPYLNELLPLVHMVLVDPVPEARATAAKALGTLVERLGEIHFPDLVPGLLRTLKTDSSGVDRQGAAQGLSEVLAGLGMERMEGLLPDIIANAQSPRSTVREGFMSLLVFLPATFGTRFSPHLPKIIGPILSGLADSEDYVREAAMRAGRMIVTNYSNKAIDLLLPELERGMFDPGWRIRQSSITLVGELLFKVSGISGKTEIEEEEEAADTALAETSRKALIEVLGAERRDRILSALYMARQDAVNTVRQSAGHIWKALVHNTPRTVREILPQLITQIVQLLASDEADQQETASRTTTELCRKSGEKIFGEIITILRGKANSTDPRVREGVCLTLCELMESTTDAQREGHEDEIITMVRVSLVDDEANVRSAAAKAFDILQEHIGVKAIDQTIPTLLEALRQPGQSSGTALQALREVMSVRASTVFPVLIPTLTGTPMSVFNARALASLVSVAGSALSKRLTVILNAIVRVLEGPEGEDEELREAVDEALSALLGSISDSEGLNTLMLVLLGWAKHENVDRRVSACNIFATFCEVTELDTELYHIDWIRQLISLLDDPQVPVHTAAWKALDAFVKSVPKDELEPLVVPLRRTIESTGSPGHHVPGFSLPKGVAPTVPIVIAGLTTGSNEQREAAAYAIADLVERTAEAAIKPFVVPFTGPLIRVATQATTYPPGVKTAILHALATMLARIPAFVKPFFPQLQRTFVKSAGDASSLAVRLRAAQGLGVLMRNQPRVDPVVTELAAAARAADDAVAASLVLALAYVVRNGGANVGEKAREACVELVADAFREPHDESYMQAAAALFAALAAFPELLQPIVENHLVAGTPPSVLASHCILAVLSPPDDWDTDGPLDVFERLGVTKSVAQKAQESATNEQPKIARPAREARDLLKQHGA
ncbi:ARM repeat-containing protein [Phanerochaete sordida]|uniref:ARM repeat-containing protein n=1 Tax=Phanerochaete sordida TaxID=48140 RepID=A0A9P3GGR0_9APHY|nr:ARM repeat-containing protein [Phanerochaete sordida]